MEHPLFPAEKSKFTRGELKECGQLFLPIYDDHCVARKTLVIRYNSCDLNFPKFITSIANTSLLKESAKAVLRSPYEQKIYVEILIHLYAMFVRVIRAEKELRTQRANSLARLVKLKLPHRDISLLQSKTVWHYLFVLTSTMASYFHRSLIRPW